MAVLSLPEMKAHLNITRTDNDAEIEMMIAAAEAAIAKRVGPLGPETITARVEGGGALILPRTPAVSVTSVTPLGSTAITTGLHLDQAAATVTYDNGAGFPPGYYDVTYEAGRATCPDDLLMALKELVRHMWTTQRGGSSRPGSQPSDALSNSLPGSAYAFPVRVEQLLAPHTQPGFA
jgi:hypothetical protein